MGVNEEQEESSLVGRMLIELVSSGSLAEQEARLHTQLGPRGCVPRRPLDREQGKRKKTCPRLLAGLGQIAEPTGTDGCRVLCHQFSISSLPRLEFCISRYNNSCLLEVKHMTPALLRWLANADQGQNSRNMVYPLNTGRPWYSVWLSRRNRYVL
jgi:hypothetical protein